MNNQDFTVGVDFTGIPNPGAPDLNNAVDLAVPAKDIDETVGKGLVLRTTDSALNTPVVPDANATQKWKRYTWKRRPFAGAADKSTKSYDWNDDVINDPTYLKWVQQTVDLTAVTALANNALATANNAVVTSSIANNTANSANTSAVAATIAANAATTASNTATTNANTAIASATLANTAANAAQLAATNAINLNTTPIAIDKRLLPSGTPQQQIRVSADLSKVEWFSPRLNFLKFSETAAKGTDNAFAAAGGANVRALNTTDIGGNGQVTLNAGTGVLTVVTAGYYKFKGYAVINRSGASAVAYQLFLIKDGAPTSLAAGVSGNLANGNTNNFISIVEGMAYLFQNDTIHMDMYISSATGVVFGKASNLNPDVGGKEVYAVLELEFLGG